MHIYAVGHLVNLNLGPALSCPDEYDTITVRHRGRRQNGPFGRKGRPRRHGQFAEGRGSSTGVARPKHRVLGAADPGAEGTLVGNVALRTRARTRPQALGRVGSSGRVEGWS